MKSMLKYVVISCLAFSATVAYANDPPIVVFCAHAGRVCAIQNRSDGLYLGVTLLRPATHSIGRFESYTENTHLTFVKNEAVDTYSLVFPSVFGSSRVTVAEYAPGAEVVTGGRLPAPDPTAEWRIDEVSHSGTYLFFVIAPNAEKLYLTASVGLSTYSINRILAIEPENLFDIVPIP